MSTRATYQINDKRYNNETRKMTFYIHHDGYKEGAAHYFYNMIETLTGTGEGYKANSKGGNIEAFLRANYNAEITESHNAHGDTEYRYTLNADNTLEVSEVSWNGDNSKELYNEDKVKELIKKIELCNIKKEEKEFLIKTDTNTETLNLIDFINKYHDEKVMEIESEYGYKQIHTQTTLQALIKRESDLLDIWTKNGHTNSANYKSLEKLISSYLEQQKKFNNVMQIV